MERDIRARGVELVLNDRVDDFTIKDGYVTTKSGQNIPTDLVVRLLFHYPCICCSRAQQLPTRGPKPNTREIISSLGSSVASSSGFIKVTPTFQLPDHPDIFAIGDITDLPEQKQAAKAGNHARIVAANIPAYLSSSTMKEYGKSVTEMIVVTNGKVGTCT